MSSWRWSGSDLQEEPSVHCLRVSQIFLARALSCEPCGEFARGILARERPVRCDEDLKTRMNLAILWHWAKFGRIPVQQTTTGHGMLYKRPGPQVVCPLARALSTRVQRHKLIYSTGHEKVIVIILSERQKEVSRIGPHFDAFAEPRDGGRAMVSWCQFGGSIIQHIKGPKSTRESENRKSDSRHQPMDGCKTGRTGRSWMGNTGLAGGR